MLIQPSAGVCQVGPHRCLAVSDSQGQDGQVGRGLASWDSSRPEMTGISQTVTDGRCYSRAPPPSRVVEAPVPCSVMSTWVDWGRAQQGSPAPWPLSGGGLFPLGRRLWTRLGRDKPAPATTTPHFWSLQPWDPPTSCSAIRCSPTPAAWAAPAVGSQALALALHGDGQTAPGALS